MTKGEESRESILETAFPLFIQKGYHGTSMRDIAKAAGLAPASIYNHYHGKDDIFYQVVLKYHPIHQILPILESAQGDSAEAMIRDVSRRVYKIIRKRKELLHLLFIEMVEFEGQHLGKIFEIGGERVFAFVRKLQQSKDQFRPISTGNIFLSIVGLLLSQWLLETAFLKNMTIPGTDDHFEAAVDIFLYGVLSREGA
jgi:AcrR family transcriptional regulator